MIPVVEMILDDAHLDLGIDALSLVERPATKALWITMSEQANVIPLEFATVDEEKRIILGPALIPNQLILREQELRGEKQKFHIFFSEETIEKSAHRYLMRGNQSNATLEHQMKIGGVSLVESWIKSDDKNDKSNAYPALSKYPKGTWYVGLKILDDEIWKNYIKTGKVKGISIEGNFADRLIEMSDHNSAEYKLNAIRQILAEYQNETSKK